MSSLNKTRIEIEREYWDKCAKDPNMDIKYISDQDTTKCKNAIGKLKGKVLEIGCGVGRLMEKPTQKSRYSGIDISSEIIQIAKKRNPDLELEVCNGRIIPYRSDYFDSVYSVLLFQHLPFSGVVSYIIETYRVLKSGGKFKFQFIEGDQKEPFSHHHKIDSIRYAIERYGFILRKIDKGLVHHQWIWITAIKP